MFSPISPSQNLGLRPNTGSVLNTQATQRLRPPRSQNGRGLRAGSVTNAFINRAFPGFNFLIGSETQPSVILDALHTVTNVKVLSNPSLVVINNQVATLQVGDVVPVSTGSATVLTTNNTVVNTIDYRNTGIILRVVAAHQRQRQRPARCRAGDQQRVADQRAAA